MDRITGQVRSMRIVRDGWGIAEVAIGSDDRATPLVGTLLGFDVGDTIEAEGGWTQHPRYGRQFRAKSIRSILPSSADGFIGWLGRKLPSIGRKRAADIVAHCGGRDEAHRAMLEEPESLAAIAGITPERARAIGAAYAAVQHDRAKMEAFVAYGLTDAQIAKLERAWGRDALDELRRDPYQLAEQIDGFGFKRSDAIALRMGLPRNHPSRAVAALHFLLEEAEGAGHTFVPAGKLVAMAARLLEVDESDVRPHYARAIDGRRAVDRKGWVFRAATDRAESSLARAIVALAGERKAVAA